MTVGERVVRIGGKLYFITISQTSESWVAVGDYIGKRVEVVGSSATDAARRWVAAVRRNGNGQSDRAADDRRK